MKHILATLFCVCSLSALSGSVNAQQGRATGWVLPGDTGLCLSGGVAAQNACARVRWTFYTWPNILKEIENAMIRNSSSTDRARPKVFIIFLGSSSLSWRPIYTEFGKSRSLLGTNWTRCSRRPCSQHHPFGSLLKPTISV